MKSELKREVQLRCYRNIALRELVRLGSHLDAGNFELAHNSAAYLHAVVELARDLGKPRALPRRG